MAEKLPQDSYTDPIILNYKLCKGQGEIIRGEGSDLAKFRCFCSQKAAMKQILGHEIFPYFQFPEKAPTKTYNAEAAKSRFLYVIHPSKEITTFYKFLAACAYILKVRSVVYLHNRDLIDIDLGNHEKYSSINDLVQGTQMFCLELGGEYPHAARDPAVHTFLKTAMRKKDSYVWINSPYTRKDSAMSSNYMNLSLDIINTFDFIKIS